jgi:hypothetical protein
VEQIEGGEEVRGRWSAGHRVAGVRRDLAGSGGWGNGRTEEGGCDVR